MDYQTCFDLHDLSRLNDKYVDFYDDYHGHLSFFSTRLGAKRVFGVNLYVSNRWFFVKLNISLFEPRVFKWISPTQYFLLLCLFIAFL